jgi:hypothetical protein
MLQMLIVGDSYLCDVLSIVEHSTAFTALPVACSTRASISCTLPVPSVVVPASRSQYLAMCDDDGYYHPNFERKIIYEHTLLSSRSYH